MSRWLSLQTGLAAGILLACAPSIATLAAAATLAPIDAVSDAATPTARPTTCPTIDGRDDARVVLAHGDFTEPVPEAAADWCDGGDDKIAATRRRPMPQRVAAPRERLRQPPCAPSSLDRHVYELAPKTSPPRSA
jgi:hypothetical protein